WLLLTQRVTSYADRVSELIRPPDEPEHGVPAVPHTATADDVATATLARVREVTGELVRLIRSAAAQATDGWSLVSVVRPLVPELERIFDQRDGFEREIQALRADLADADEHIRELETGLAAREAGWKAERAVLENDVAREHDQVELLSAELTHQRA